MSHRPGGSTKLVVVTTVPESAWTILRGQLRYLSEHGFDVSLVSSPGRLLDAVGEREGVPVYAVPMCRNVRVLADLQSLARLLRVLRVLAPDVVLAGTPKAGLLAGLAGALLRVKLRVYVMRGLRLETTSGVARAVLWMAERLSVLCAHVTLVVSPSLRDRAAGLGLLARRRAVVLGKGASNGVDARRFSAIRDTVALRRKFGISDDAFIFGFVGRITKDKGVAELVEAFLSLSGEKPRQLVLVGREEAPGVPSRIRQAIASNDSIIHIPWLEETADVYSVVNVLVLPTYREGFPNVVLEAGAAAVPAVSTRTTGATDAVLDGETGVLVPPRDAAALTSAMQRLMDEPDSARKMGESARDFVIANFTNETVWQNLGNFLHSQTP